MQILICDDNPNDRAFCHELIDRYVERFGSVVTVREFTSGDELLFQAEDIHKDVDVIYMDINMPKIDGIETSKKLRKLGYEGEIVIFAKSTDRVLEAFDFNALHFLVKGVTSDEKFFSILEKAREKREEREKEVLVLTCAGETRAFPIEKIVFFDIQQRIVTMHGLMENFSFYSTMGKLEEQLFGKDFIRTHKSYLVNRNFIKKATAQDLTLMDGTAIPIGRKYLTDVREMLKDLS